MIEGFFVIERVAHSKVFSREYEFTLLGLYEDIKFKKRMATRPPQYEII